MLESIKKNKYGILIMCLSSICACIGQLFWKLSYSSDLLLIILGLGIYSIGAMLMILAYRFGSLSVLQPVLSLNYVFSIIIAATILKEEISINKVIGVSVIIIGVSFIVGGDK